MTVLRLDRHALVDVALVALAELAGLAAIVLRYRRTHPKEHR